MILSLAKKLEGRRISLGLSFLFLFACYDLWVHPQLFDGQEMSLCITKNIWGIPCPACGTAHGIQHLAKGELKAAFFSNPLSYLVIAAFPLFIFLSVRDLFLGKGEMEKFFVSLSHFFMKKPVFLWLFGIFILINWIWNLLKM